MRSSLRLRLAIWAGLLAGTALGGFAGVAWWIAWDGAVGRLDSMMALELMPEALRPNNDNWAALDRRLRDRVDGPVDAPPRVALWVRDPDSAAPIYHSPGWPAGLDPQAPVTGHPPPPPFPMNLLRPPPPGRPDDAPRDEPTIDAAGRHWRVAFGGRPGAAVTIAISLAVIRAELAPVATGFMIAVPLGLLWVAGGAWLLSSRALRPIRRLAASIERVNAQGLGERLPAGHEDDEIEILIASFNAMLERLERSFRQATRFSGDAAHELRTPLAILQGELERALNETEPGSPAQARLADLLDEVRRLSGICRKLLLLSLADAGQLSLQRERIALDAAIADLIEDIQALAPGLAIDSRIAPDLMIDGDAGLIRQVLLNLATNAVKYNVPDGWIRLDLDRSGAMARLIVANAAHGVAESERGRLFDRFYRVDRRGEGVGLGLSLAREIIRAHGGDLVLLDPRPGEERFQATLPLA